MLFQYTFHGLVKLMVSAFVIVPISCVYIFSRLAIYKAEPLNNQCLKFVENLFAFNYHIASDLFIEWPKYRQPLMLNARLLHVC